MLIIAESFAGCLAACDDCWTLVVETEPFSDADPRFVSFELDTVAPADGETEDEDDEAVAPPPPPPPLAAADVDDDEVAMVVALRVLNEVRIGRLELDVIGLELRNRRKSEPFHS